MEREGREGEREIAKEREREREREFVCEHYIPVAK